MGTKLELVPAAPGKRLGAAVLDWLAPAVVLVVLFSLGFASVTSSRSGGFIVYDTGTLALLGGIAVSLTLIYIAVLASLEGRSGSTIGSRAMGIRTTDKDGYAPGTGAVILRGAVTGAGVLLAVAAALVVVIFKWFDAAPLILGPLALAGAAWAVLVVVSNSWDKDGGLQGWQDRAAKTLVFDVHAGRNPVTTGGIQGPYSFAPLDLPPVRQVTSPVAVAAGAAHRPGPGQPNSGPPDAGHPDDALDSTQLRGSRQEAPPVAVLRIRLDDGRDFRLERSVLVGRNPAAGAGESQAQLLAVPDPGRTISKTHLHLLTDGAGVWVTDRNSTNGSAITTPDGLRTALVPGVPSFVSPGTTVHFGDRTFNVGQA
ncbi:RDD family protein [Arthrobacter sp. NPDC093139]|uniref:RDD family protein n=1 Tax=Arthrobacter sp. NPDC093139 TaxID=3363945 RepID=UPI003812B590